MKVPEKTVLIAALRLFTVKGFRLWRNNCGAYKMGSRYIRYGVANPGGADLIGYKTVLVTPDMLGSKVAIFTAIECKTTGGKLSEYQKLFLDEVKNAGGITQVIHSMDDLKT